MATFHKIVLAIASSLNNGTSSLAPQGGNRALSNQTNALAERQAQPSAKTPPIPNPIGKGIGKFWIPLLLATATVLTPSKTEAATLLDIMVASGLAQRLADRGFVLSRADARITVNSDGTRVTNRVNPRTLQAIPNTQPSAVLNPVVVNPVTGAALRKGAIKGGKWLIAVLAEYGVHSAIDRVLANNRDQKATATVHGAQWVSNEYSIRFLNPNSPPPRNDLTTMADMGDEDDLSTAVGWNAISNRSMTQHEAKGYLERRIGSITVSTWAAIAPSTNPRILLQTMFFPIKARSDHYAVMEAQTLALYRANFPGIIFTKGGESIEKWKVGSFEMESDFDDPAPILKALGTENAIDSDANYYEATARWQYRELNPNGTWSKWYKGKKKFSQETADGIKSWEDHTFSFDFCKDNQEITDPEIYEGIERFVSTRDVEKKFFKIEEKIKWIGLIRYRQTFYTHEWRPVDEEPVVVQQYQDLTGN